MQNKTNEYSAFDFIEPVPQLHSSTCKTIAFVIGWSLTLFPYMLAILFFFLYDFFIALTALGITYLATGIIRSKLRILSIPPMQLEFNYDDMQIARWYTAKHLCYEKIV